MSNILLISNVLIEVDFYRCMSKELYVSNELLFHILLLFHYFCFGSLCKRNRFKKSRALYTKIHCLQTAIDKHRRLIFSEPAPINLA